MLGDLGGLSEREADWAEKGRTWAQVMRHMGERRVSLGPYLVAHGRKRKAWAQILASLGRKCHAQTAGATTPQVVLRPIFTLRSFFLSLFVQNSLSSSGYCYQGSIINPWASTYFTFPTWTPAHDVRRRTPPKIQAFGQQMGLGRRTSRASTKTEGRLQGDAKTERFQTAAKAYRHQATSKTHRH